MMYCIVYCVAEVCLLAGSTTAHIGRQDSRNRNDSMPPTGTFVHIHLNSSSFFLQPWPHIRTAFSFPSPFPPRTPPVHLAIPAPPPPFSPFHPLDLSHSFSRESPSLLASTISPGSSHWVRIYRGLDRWSRTTGEGSTRTTFRPKRGKENLLCPQGNNSTTRQEKKWEKITRTHTKQSKHGGSVDLRTAYPRGVPSSPEDGVAGPPSPSLALGLFVVVYVRTSLGCLG